MTLNLATYATALWQMADDPATTKESLRDLAQKLSQLASDVDTALSSAGAPSGAIILYTGSACPSGYTEVTALRSAFPRGAPAGTPGGTGGASTHTHNITLTDLSPAGGLRSMNNGTGAAVTLADSTHTHGNTGSAGSASNLPPYVDVLYCQKT